MRTIYYSNARNPAIQLLEEPKSGSWIHIVQPTDEELEQLATEFKLDLDLLHDAIDLYESPRVEVEDKNVYVFTRYCFPVGADIATEPLLLIHTPDHLITIARTESSVLLNLTSGATPIITTQRTKTFLQILVEVNLSYQRHIHRISRQILSIRSQLRKATINNQVFVDMIDIEEDLNEVVSALEAQGVVLRTLLNGRYLRLYEEDRDLIEDLSLGTGELIGLSKSRLLTISNTREAYSTIMANTLNKTFRLLTSIGIFLTVPMIIASLYGMNVALPFENDVHAFWYISIVGTVLTVFIVWLFRKLNWL